MGNTVIRVCYLLSMMAIWGPLHTAEATEDCSLGHEFALRGDYDNSIIKWRDLAYDNTHKEWLRSVRNCLLNSGIATNDMEVVGWLETASENGNTDATIFVALVYLNGIGVDKDIEIAKELLSEAASNGSEAAERLQAVIAD